MLQFNNTKILSFPRFKIIKNEKLKVRNYKGFNLTNITTELKKISQKIINRKIISHLDYYKSIASLHGYDFILYDEIKKNKNISRNLLNFRKKNKHISYLENRCHPFAKQDDKILIFDMNRTNATQTVQINYDGEINLNKAIVADWFGNGVHPNLTSASQFTLNAAYPNPFNPSTSISYSLTDNNQVRVEIYNINGKLVETLVNEYQTAGLQIGRASCRERV